MKILVAKKDHIVKVLTEKDKTVKKTQITKSGKDTESVEPYDAVLYSVEDVVSLPDKDVYCVYKDGKAIVDEELKAEVDKELQKDVLVEKRSIELLRRHALLDLKAEGILNEDGSLK